ncbi:hypothetical protein QBC35DRAFT_142058 [Podospora australis]|uniref:WD repeat-containing protein 79 n=1 Tax=Podospora australis TaxID=1536484 RepID=A0AAN7AK02_9PEZI|nr:hypothetical protein QBC35DRAFT_142058 [Podospora australis]
MDKPSATLVAESHNPDGPHLLTTSSSSSKDPFFKSVQWTSDGTTLITSSSTNHISSFVLPSTLLDPSRSSPLSLSATSTIPLPEPTSSLAPCPYFSLENPYSQVLLTASTDHPLHLRSLFPSSSSPESQKPIASFRLIKHETEAYLPVTSLLWPSPGTHFIAGTTNKIALFDVSRPDSLVPEPVFVIPTIPSTRHISKGNGIGMKGTVSALSLSPSEEGSSTAGLLAAGTWTRWLGLYDIYRSAKPVANWSVKPAADETNIGGKGIVQTQWSPCGRYLVVNERGATGLLVYDLRGASKGLLCHLAGRDGTTNQRLSLDVFPSSNENGGFEVWAGTKDGKVVVYEGVGTTDTAMEPAWEWEASTGGVAAIGATAMHLGGSVVATCSGSWRVADVESDSDSESDSESEEETEEENGETDSSSGSSSSSSSSEASARSHITKPKPRIVVEETSLKVWTIGGGGGGYPSPGPETMDGETRD